jgi:hypothetical protein
VFDLAQFIKLIHVISAMMLIAGLIGRQLTRAQIARATDIRIFQAYIELSGRFENLLVIPGSLLVLVAGLVIAVIRGWPILGFLQGASANWLLVSLVLFLSLIPLVRFVFLPRGKIFEQALQDALAQGQITPELTAAFHDPIVRRAHFVEAFVVAFILYLMVMKPF